MIERDQRYIASSNQWCTAFAKLHLAINDDDGGDGDDDVEEHAPLAERRDDDGGERAEHGGDDDDGGGVERSGPGFDRSVLAPVANGAAYAALTAATNPSAIAPAQYETRRDIAYSFLF